MTTAAPSTITREQVEFYHENGYLLMPKLLPDDVLQALRDETDRIVAEAAGLTDHNAQYDLEDSHSPEEPRVRRLKSPSSHWPFFRELAQHPVLMEVVTALIGPNVRLQNDKLNMKAAEYGAPVEWHQDWPSTRTRTTTSSRRASCLTTASRSTGRCWSVPGSHKRQIYDHHHPEGRYFTGAVEPEEFDWDMEQDLVALEGPAGSVSFHHVRTMHGSALNRSENQRRLLLFGYAPRRTPGRSWVWGRKRWSSTGASCAPANRLNNRARPRSPAYLPLPASPKQGSIYENQKTVKNRFFDTYEDRQG